jgi:hypothetical protein
VDDRATGEVQRPLLGEPAAAEHHVGDRGVHEHEPHPDEQGVGPELEPVGRGPRDEGGRDDGEGHLVGGEQHERDRQRQGVGEERLRRQRRADVLHPGVVEVPDEPPVPAVAEGQRERDRGPQHAEQAHREDVLHEHAEHVLGAHHAPVEQREPGCHEQHERCRGQHPSGIARIQLHPHSFRWRSRLAKGW